VIRTDGWEIRVEQVRENRVEAVRIIPIAADSPFTEAPEQDLK
jgi:hypothetical protein